MTSAIHKKSSKNSKVEPEKPADAWESVIGLEVHVQLSTLSKLFSGAATAYGAEPNTQACAIDLALPGVLPVLNAEAVNMAIKFGLSIQADIPHYSIFSRKNYFYPDLPKGYQISQHENPIVGPGHLTIVLENGEQKIIRITRAHLEEDAGKSLHEGFENMTGIDLNRAGTPLLEIVSEPDLTSPKEAVIYLKTLHTLVRYLDISDGNLQEGSFRCDANVSVRRANQKQLGKRVEIKNLNSFRFIEKAIQYEIERQIAVLENGGHIDQETRLYDTDKQETRPMRSKEDAKDYRYFTDPDLCPVFINADFIETLYQTLPELPQKKLARFQTDYKLSAYDASLLTATCELANYFEEVVKENVPAKLAVNWIMGELAAALNKSNFTIIESPISAKRLATLLQRIADNTISSNIAKNVFEELWSSNKTTDKIIQEKNLQQITDQTAILRIIDEILIKYPEQLADYRSGKNKLFGFFVGQVMKASGGKVNPQQLNHLLKEKLDQ
ncbi:MULTISPECIES: Asp-tRNA(Asn)/Glu-tRNA(Gln) amidotransferase subunit GatB [Rickettsiella]|jgi:aspartyl-tRNA(Asn)/glutamyl-tRNA(Gln) amidotransferase subunit B|uniref:Asp-tRNA(Asn)/Glu-tRNA(Gln) amidotransferase subunit GatB n=1 Tax=Rickettsiella TaxID=59195 RepID=UPI000A03A89F|nr:Asp-tRNA(Asn)/Glu-tRNA(Gln) amidotransferase subunit GatB [Candidatus Rickettsiella isopodorum]MCH9637548.1 Asp-tRNA(Asn)/Glu-tRNA(Gln) amidotransferase subunit GatB [Gammaproteobacteria bacterium]MCH9754938.1 Asp-tRNA(Asn)/Glu-tRNA(Gln) amidotransferase subunit GatB [Gammaproteobacteria bacterium]MDD5161669.1 Asp-tRNA(Asn)/Glu-tRNA(Gln) amidotransferase subunit GatB [Candidatus Rickettsiella isopodorum]MDQ5899199.1 aspartyl-tRNA(Asn)/glutamyl-tRNA(Gln) amidotransferase subunit [Pseudomonado